MKVPDQWSVRQIGKICTSIVPGRNKPKEFSGTIPWVTTPEITGRYIPGKKQSLYLNDYWIKEAGAKKVPSGSVIMVCVGDLGLVAIAKEEVVLNQQLHAFVCPSNIYNEYCAYAVEAQKSYMYKVASTTTIPYLNKTNCESIRIPLPPLPEQKAIANLLSTWDEAIEKTEQLIQAKESNLKGQIQKRIGKKCKAWSHVKPKKIFDTITEKNFPDEELLSVTQDRGVIPRSMLEGRVMSPEGTTAGYKLIKRGDFAISLRSFQGGIEYSNYQGIISPAYTVLRPKIELDTNFYRLFFKSYLFIEKYLGLAVIGIRDGKQISIPDFLSIKIPVPPLVEQKQIAETLNIAQQEIDLLKQLAEKYKTQKRGLMQKVLTGEWRIKPEVVKRYA